MEYLTTNSILLFLMLYYTDAKYLALGYWVVHILHVYRSDLILFHIFFVEVGFSLFLPNVSYEKFVVEMCGLC